MSQDKVKARHATRCKAEIHSWCQSWITACRRDWTYFSKPFLFIAAAEKVSLPQEGLHPVTSNSAATEIVDLATHGTLHRTTVGHSPTTYDFQNENSHQGTAPSNPWLWRQSPLSLFPSVLQHSAEQGKFNHTGQFQLLVGIGRHRYFPKSCTVFVPHFPTMYFHPGRIIPEVLGLPRHRVFRPLCANPWRCCLLAQSQYCNAPGHRDD